MINDWFDDGTIDQHVSAALLHGGDPAPAARHPHVLERGRRHPRRDARGVQEGRRNAAGPAAADVRAATSRAGRPSSDSLRPAGAPKAEEPKQGLILRAIEWLGPSDAGAVPLPLLILAGVAFLLLAAAGGSLVNRRLQERRLPPPPQA